MKILFVTNYYPPSVKGWGYMQLCEEVADGLAARGHEICLLTSSDGAEYGDTHTYPVHRWLTIDPDWNSDQSAVRQFFIGRRQREQQAVASFRRLIDKFKPDLVFIWHAIGLPRVLLHAAEQLTTIPSVYYLAGYLPEVPDEYFAYWRSMPGKLISGWIKQGLATIALTQLRREGKPIRLAYPYVICVSEYVRGYLVERNLINPDNAVVIHNGVDLNVFCSTTALDLESDEARPLRLLVAGRIVPEKGLHTVIKAIGHLKRLGELPEQSLTLTILGDGPLHYRYELEALIQEAELQDLIRFQAPVPRADMPKILKVHQCLILPSEYNEPIARSMQEAMAMGLLVIGTTTGGSGELLVHEQTGLVFKAGDCSSLAEQLHYAMQFPKHAMQLARAGREMVQDCFTIDLTVERIESYLACLIDEDKGKPCVETAVA